MRNYARAFAKANPHHWGSSPLSGLFCRDEEDNTRAAASIVNVIDEVLEANGISPHFQAIEQKRPEQLLLAA